MSQTVLKQMPPGITPPLILSFDASSVPVLQLALSSDKLPETTLFDDATSFIRAQLASVAGARYLALWRRSPGIIPLTKRLCPAERRCGPARRRNPDVDLDASRLAGAGDEDSLIAASLPPPNHAAGYDPHSPGE